MFRRESSQYSCKNACVKSSCSYKYACITSGLSTKLERWINLSFNSIVYFLLIVPFSTTHATLFSFTHCSSSSLSTTIIESSKIHQLSPSHFSFIFFHPPLILICMNLRLDVSIACNTTTLAYSLDLLCRYRFKHMRPNCTNEIKSECSVFGNLINENKRHKDPIIVLSKEWIPAQWWLGKLSCITIVLNFCLICYMRRFQDWRSEQSVSSENIVVPRRNDVSVFDSLKERTARVFAFLGNLLHSETSNRSMVNERKSATGTLHPQGPFLQKWNRIFVISCIFAVSVDPLFLYIPVISDEKPCWYLDRKLEKAASVLRFFTDIFYILHIIFQFRTGFLASSPRTFGRGVLIEDRYAITKRYLSTYFFIDVFAILPIPQVLCTPPLCLQKYFDSIIINALCNILDLSSLLKYLIAS